MDENSLGFNGIIMYAHVLNFLVYKVTIVTLSINNYLLTTKPDMLPILMLH